MSVQDRGYRPADVAGWVRYLLIGRPRAYGAALTSIDLLKAFAICTMIVDHIAYYEFIDDDWLRAVGRASAPFWAFLIGYAATTRLDARLVAATVLITAWQVAMGFPLLPIKILATFLLIRWLRQLWLTNDFLQGWRLVVLWAGCSALFLSTLVAEYMTEAILFASLGIMVREGRGQAFSVRLFACATVLTYVVAQSLMFGFTPPQQSLVLFLMTLGAVVMLNFRLFSYDRTAGWPVAGPALRFLGRRNLEIYVLHLLIFMALYRYPVLNL